MKSILTYLTLMLLPFLASGQSLLVITDTFQERNNFVSSAEQELLQDARMTVERYTHDQVYAHFCSGGEGIHHTQGKQNTLLHLDSIPSITMYTSSSWKAEKTLLIPGLIQHDFALSGAMRIEVFCNGSEIDRLKEQLLKPMASTFNLISPDGTLNADRLSIRVHHGYKEPDGKSITTIQSL